MRWQMITALLLAAPWATAAAQDTTANQMPQRDTITGLQSQRREGPQDDKALVQWLHRTNQVEIRAGQLAQRNGQSSRVKEFGQQLVRDHQSADQQVTQLAQRLGITLERGLDTTGQMNQGQRRGMQRDTTQRQDPMNPDPMRRDTTSGQGGYGQRSDTTQGAFKQDSMHGGHMQGQGQPDELAQLRRLETLRGAQFDAEFANLMARAHDKAIKKLQQAQSQVQNSELRTLVQNTLPRLRTHLQIAQSLGGSITTTSSIQ